MESSYIFIVLFIIIIIIILQILSSHSIPFNTNKFKVEERKDKGANRIYAYIELLDDRVIINNTNFILFSNIEKARVESSMQEIRMVNSLIYGGRRYKQGMVYWLHIYYKDKYGSNTSKTFGSLDSYYYNLYKVIADRINSKVGYVETKVDHKITEL